MASLLVFFVFFGDHLFSAGKTVSVYSQTDENLVHVLEQYFESRVMENFQNENGPRLEKGWEPLL